MSDNLIRTHNGEVVSSGDVINQSGARAAGDIVARDKIEHHYHPQAAASGVVEKLIRRLQSEIALDIRTQHTIDALASFQKRRPVDGIEGLEAKLQAAGREDEIWAALDKKEQFAKLLQKWSLYASAQEIFAYLLAESRARVQSLRSSQNCAGVCHGH
ncbi:hypothetical protein ACVW1A_002784 [Bradyrhizobium sp. LB1.3]